MANPPFAVPFPNFQADTEADASQVNANNAAITAALNSAAFQGYSTTINPQLSADDPTGAANVQALQAAITQGINTPGGALIQLPAGAFLFNNSLTISGSTGGLIIQGSSTGTKLYQTGAVDFFVVSNNGESNGSAGIRFRDIWFEYSGTPTTGNCINANNGGGDTTADSCYFNNCPTAFNAGSDGRALHCGLMYCTVVQAKVNNTVSVILSAAQNFVFQCIIRQQPIAGGGPTGCTAIQINNAPIAYVSECHVSDYTVGIQVTQGCNFIYLHHNTVQSYQTGILIQPTTNVGVIYGVWISDSTVLATHTVQGAGSNGIIVDTNGGTATNVQGIFLNNVLAMGWNDAGLKIIAASNVVVTGGMFASNGQSPSATANGAGIAVVGAADSIRVTGSDLIGTIGFITGVQQPYAAALSGGCTNVEFYVCNMTGNANSLPVYTNGTITHWYVNDCRGYNTFNFVIASSAPATTVQFDGTGFGSPLTPWSTPYLGPYLVCWTGATVSNVKISHDRSSLSATPIGALPTGAIHLRQAQSMELDYTGGPFTTFEILGQ